MMIFFQNFCVELIYIINFYHFFFCLIIKFVKIIENNLVRYNDLPDQTVKQPDQIVKQADQFSQIFFLLVKYMIDEGNLKISSYCNHKDCINLNSTNISLIHCSLKINNFRAICI